MSTESEPRGKSWLDSLKMTMQDVFGGGKLDSGQELSVEVLFGLLGWLARADSIVTDDEAQYVNDLLDELQLSLAGRRLAMHAFDQGRQRAIDLKKETSRFLAVYPKGSTELTKLYDTLLRLAAVDERIRPGERAFLEQITQMLGFAPDTLDARLKLVSGR